MAIRPRLPAAIRGELGVAQQKKKHQKRSFDREPRKKRKLYQPQSDDDESTQLVTKSIVKKKKKIARSTVDALPKSADDVLMDRDDAEIDYWEAKLGQKQGVPQDELEDGLDDLFSGLDLPRGASRLEELSDGIDEESGSEGDMQAFLDAEDADADEDGEIVPELAHVTNQDNFTQFEDERETETSPIRAKKASIYQPYSTGAPNEDDASVPAKPTVYVPPALRNKSSGTDTTQLQRLLKGQVNRLSAVNISTIVNELEALYRTNPRGVINDTIATHLMEVVSDKSGLLDSFVVLHAALIAALYKLHGTDFGASFVQRLVEAILACAGKELSTGRRGINLMALMAELYNLNIVSATLPYDFIRLLLADLNELNVEILLVIVKSSGPQLRSDDPSSLKDILNMLQAEMKTQYNDKDVPLRMKFMVDSLLNLKNNKLSNTEGQQVKELRIRMRKYIGGLVASTGQAGSEPLRVSLDDIRNVETRGKWWLVGASWRNQEHPPSAQSDRQSQIAASKKSDSQQEELQALARMHRLNNPIRKQIFITVLSSSDYLEAITSILSLRLKKAQESEISRVLILLVGSEERYNPFYTHIAKGLSDRHGMRISFQFCLWDFMRDCGETDVGQIGSHLEDGQTAEAPSTRKIINVAKFFGALVGFQVLPLTVFKTLTFSRLQKTTKLFLDVLLSEAFLVMHSSIKVISKIQQQRDFEKKVSEIFAKIKQFDAANGTSMVKGLDWFLRKVIVKCGAVLEQDRSVVEEGVEIARIVLSQ